MGLTLLAAGTSVPDLLTSVIVARYALYILLQCNITIALEPVLERSTYYCPLLIQARGR